MKVLLTGGAGYIGSHTAVKLVENGYKVYIIDNLANSKLSNIKNIEKITSRNINFKEIDLTNRSELEEFFMKNHIDAVIHLAALKSIPDSQKSPFIYYHNNISGSLNLIEMMNKYEINKMIFSSTASVYSHKNISPFKESDEIGPENPYARSKLFIEIMLNDMAMTSSNLKTIILRYFNPVGAHSTALIGEDPIQAPNNIMPIICKVANQEQEKLQIFGKDYNTKDGTGVRDFIHIDDLACGHVAALEKLNEKDNAGFEIVNLGTGVGHTVLELVNAFQEVNKVSIPYEFSARREGDIETAFADPSYAYKFLSWRSKKGLEEMCRDVWRWSNKK